ncbi:MAG: TRAP transporter large permease subunit, partial [Pseudomonadota bacterium]
MEPLLLGAIVAVITVLVLFSGVSVATGLLIVSAGFLLVFDGMRSLELLPEIFFAKLNNFALLSIPMFIIMGALVRTGALDAFTGLADRQARTNPTMAVILLM